MIDRLHPAAGDTLQLLEGHHTGNSNDKALRHELHNIKPLISTPAPHSGLPCP